MSETQKENPTPQPNDDAAPDISEGERIRRLLVAKIESGTDLRDREQRIAACHEIEKELNVPYGNIVKQVEKSLRIAAKNAGQPPESFKKSVGGAEVEVKSPKRVTEDTAPAAAAPEGKAAEQAKPPKPKLSDIYAAAANEKELRETMEYRWLRKSIETGRDFVQGTYQKIGILEKEETLIPKEQEEMMLDMSAQMCMKYDWKMPEQIEKIMFLGSWGMLLILPPLAKFGILEDIKNGTLGKKKKDDKKSSEPLAKTGQKV